MSGTLSSDIHDELEKAKETVRRLRCIYGVSPGFHSKSAVCPRCWRHEHDVTIGRCSERDGPYSGRKDGQWDSINQPYFIIDCNGYSNTSSKTPMYIPLNGDSYPRAKNGLLKMSDKTSSASREKAIMSHTKSTMSPVDLKQVHEQINSLEKDIRGPVLSYVKNIEQQNRDLADAVKTIQLQLSKHQRERHVGYREISEGLRISPDKLWKHSESAQSRSWFGDSERDELKQRLNASYQTEQANRFRADSLEKELSICQQKLEKAEEKVKELHRNLSRRQVNGRSVSSEVVLKSQLKRQQQLAESYLKESSSKEKELSFLTIEKYNLQNEVSSLRSDLQSCKRKRNDMTQEQKKLQAALEAKRQKVRDLENELAATKSENQRLKTQFRDELSKERAVSEQKSEKLYADDREIKDLGKMDKKYTQNDNSKKDVTHCLGREKLELLSKAQHLDSELKTSMPECSSLQQENNGLSKEVNIQHEATMSKNDSENAILCQEDFKSEFQEAKDSAKGLGESLAASKVNKSRSSSEIEKINSKEFELRSQIENAEKDKKFLAHELIELRQREAEYTNELKGAKESFGTSENDLKELNENFSALHNELAVSWQKYLEVKEEQLSIVETDREKLRQDVTKLQAKLKQAEKSKEDWERREQEIKASQRSFSDKADLEGKVSRFKDRCREKDDEIDELHKKVIALQVKIKDFVRENSNANEQVRELKEKYTTELNEKERMSHALLTADKKYRGLKKDMEYLKNSNKEWEKKVQEMKTKAKSLESEKEESSEKLTELLAELEKNKEERDALKKQLEELEETTKEHEEVLAVSDIPAGANIQLDNVLESSRLSLSQNSRATALDRQATLEEENIQLLNKQSELEDELDAAEEHAQELKNALKSKRDNANDLHAELDIMRERVKNLEKHKAELSDENEQLQQTCFVSKQKIEDLKVASEQYIEESDELEKALTTAEQRIEELEKQLEEMSSKFASSKGQLQSMSERLSRKERELEVVENQVEEQRKLCDGYKASAEKQETLIENIRGEKTNAEEALLAMKVEIAKKDATHKAGKEKVSAMQSRLYETEDKISMKTNELKKLNRENERLKREIKDLESKVSELQMMLKKSKSLELEKTSPVTGVYNTKFQTITSSVKGNTQNMEGLDTKLNQAQNKISTLEVELANDLRKFSLHRTSSDALRRPFSQNLSTGSYTSRRPRSNSNLSANDSPSRSGSTPSINEDQNAGVKTRSSPDISIHQLDVEHRSKDESQALFLNLGDGTDLDEQNQGTLRENLSEVDPFLSAQTTEFSTEDLSSSEHFETRTDQNLTNEAMSFFQELSTKSSPVQEEVTVQDTVTSSTAHVTGNITPLSSPSMHQDSNGQELIYF